MALPEYRAGRDIGGLRLLDGQRHRLGVDTKTKAPMAVDHGRGRRFLDDGPFRAGNDMAGLDAVDIGRDCDNAVGVVARQIGVDAAHRHGAGLFVRCAGGLEQRSADARETVGLNGRHKVPRRLRACRSWFLRRRMVSKRWRLSNDPGSEILVPCNIPPSEITRGSLPSCNYARYCNEKSGEEQI